MLLISSNDLDNRVEQHNAVIDAAQRANVSLLAYTSILRADTSPMGLAADHKDTEVLLSKSSVPFTLLRHSWYNENHISGIPGALENGALLGSAGEGRIASASRADYAAAAAAVLTLDNQAGKVYELAGDTSYSLNELAAEIAQQSGQPVAYQNLPEAEYNTTLMDFGLPEAIANLLSNSDAGAAKGGLFDDGRQLSQLIGRPTTPIRDSVSAALQA